MVRIVNLTPHPVTVRWEGGERTWPEPPQAEVARLDDVAEQVGLAGGVPLVCLEPWNGGVLGLPEPDPRSTEVVRRAEASLASLSQETIDRHGPEARNPEQLQSRGPVHIQWKELRMVLRPEFLRYLQGFQSI